MFTAFVSPAKSGYKFGRWSAPIYTRHTDRTSSRQSNLYSTLPDNVIIMGVFTKKITVVVLWHPYEQATIFWIHNRVKISYLDYWFPVNARRQYETSSRKFLKAAKMILSKVDSSQIFDICNHIWKRSATYFSVPAPPALLLWGGAKMRGQMRWHHLRGGNWKTLPRAVVLGALDVGMYVGKIKRSIFTLVDFYSLIFPHIRKGQIIILHLIFTRCPCVLSCEQLGWGVSFGRWFTYSQRLARPALALI